MIQNNRKGEWFELTTLPQMGKLYLTGVISHRVAGTQKTSAYNENGKKGESQ